MSGLPHVTQIICPKSKGNDSLIECSKNSRIQIPNKHLINWNRLYIFFHLSHFESRRLLLCIPLSRFLALKDDDMTFSIIFVCSLYFCFREYSSLSWDVYFVCFRAVLCWKTTFALLIIIASRAWCEAQITYAGLICAPKIKQLVMCVLMTFMLRSLLGVPEK